METRALKVFLSVAQTLNFSRSSEQLHMSVSAVSRTVQRLEDDLGQPLLERDSRNVRLTPSGGDFRHYAQRTVAEWEQVRRRLRGSTELSGEVSVYCSVTASYSVLAPILDAFRTAHSAVDIMLHTGDQADGINRILTGQDDIAVTGRPRQLPARVEFLPLLQSPLKFYMPAAHCAVRSQVLSGKPSESGFDWSAVPFSVPERGISKELLDLWFSAQGATPHIYAQVAGHEAIAAMVGLGLGVGVAPELVVATGGFSESLEVIEVAQPLPALDIGLCSLKQRLANPLVQSLWSVAGQTYRPAI